MGNRSLVPNMIRIALLTFAIGAAMGDLGTIQRMSTLTSICDDCDMTLFGTINVKVCGGGGGVGGYEPCCSVVNIANFDSGLFQQGQLDDFTGQALEDCDNYSLSQVDIIITIIIMIMTTAEQPLRPGCDRLPRGIRRSCARLD